MSTVQTANPAMHRPGLEPAGHLVGGVDTHQDTHTAAALDTSGRLLDVPQFPATTKGYVALLEWLGAFGTVVAVGIEGTGAYGLGLTQPRCRPECDSVMTAVSSGGRPWA